LGQAGAAGASGSSVFNSGTAHRAAVHTLAVWAAELCTRGFAMSDVYQRGAAQQQTTRTAVLCMDRRRSSTRHGTCGARG